VPKLWARRCSFCEVQLSQQINSTISTRRSLTAFRSYTDLFIQVVFASKALQDGHWDQTDWNSQVCFLIDVIFLELSNALCSGHFHADEALAVFLLRLTPTFKAAALTRSRDSAILEQCDIIVDVEGKYDGVKHFDHHQRGFEHTFSDKFNTKLSSAGLIYKYSASLGFETDTK
jgi:Uncharacterised protein family (UPF0160)